MPRRAYTRDLYDRLVEGFRDAPGNFSQAGRHAGCGRRAAKRAWEQGWSNLPWARPIRDVLAEERTTALALCADRAKAREEREAAQREAARDHAVQTVAVEEEILGRSREVILRCLGVAQQLEPAMETLAQRVTSEAIAHGDAISAAEAMRLMGRFVTVVGQLVRASEQLVKLGHVERGTPSEIVEVRPPAEVDLSDEQALHYLEMAADLHAEYLATKALA